MIGWSGFGRALVQASLLLAASGISAQPAPSDACGLALTSHYIGALAVPTVRSTIVALSAPAIVRWIAPGRSIKPDLNPQRLNVILDEAGRITAMRCG